MATRFFPGHARASGVLNLVADFRGWNCAVSSSIHGFEIVTPKLADRRGWMIKIVMRMVTWALSLT
jgi:hypothetical protein